MLLLLLQGGAPVVATVPAFTINGTDKTTNVHLASGMDLSYTLGGRALARLKTVDISSNSTATAYSPDVDYTVSVEFGGTTLFAGNVVGKVVDALGPPMTGIATDIEALDYSAALDQRIINEVYPVAGGWTTKTIIQDLVTTYLATYGITADAGMPTGSALATDLLLDKLTARAALNRIALLNNWIWRVTPAKVLQAGPIGTFAAAYSLTSSNAKVVGGISWRKQRTQYGNWITVRYGGERVVLKTFSTTGNGVLTSWPLDYVPLLNFSGTVVSQGVITEGTNLYYPLFGTVAGVTWSYDAGTNSLTRSPALPNGTTATWQYATQFPANAAVSDPSEITAHGLYELIVEAPDITTKEEAAALGNALLLRNATLPRAVTIGTFEGMEFPGTVITLTIPERSLSGSWLITGVRVRSVANDRLFYEFTCLEGSTTQSTWLDYLASVFGGAASAASDGSGQFAGSFIPAPSGLFPTDVVANGGENTPATGVCELGLRGALFPGQGTGPGVCLGRLDDSSTWVILAEQVLGSSPPLRRLAFTPWGDKSSSAPWAMALEQAPTPAAGEYYLVPYTSKKLTLGGPLGTYGGASNYLEGVHTRHLAATSTSGLQAVSALGGSSTGSSNGLYVQAGSNSSDFAIKIRNRDDNATWFQILGDASTALGGPVTASAGVTVTGGSGSATLHSAGGVSRWAVTAQGDTASGTSLGLLVQGGTNTSDTALKVLNAAGATTYVEVRGDGNLTLARAIVESGLVVPAQITADQNDYNPTGLTTGSSLMLSSDATRAITGIVPPMATNGCRLAIHNAGSNTITLNHEDTNSTAANRFALPGAANFAITANSGVELIYYASRWRALFK
jgi:hypothetical protein